MSETPRGIVVLDIGSTNTKILLFDQSLNPVRSETVPSRKRPAPPYDAIDPEPILDLAAAVLPDLDAVLPVDVVVPCTHGSAFALLDAAGKPTLPMMDYNAEVPDEIAASYPAPPFAEVLAPVNPGALTVGRQFHWQETAWPEAWAETRTILPFAQYIAHRLGGRAVSECTSLGAQTQLWAMSENRPSTLATARGWADRFAPLAPAWATVGHLTDRFGRLRGRGEIRAGIHDSSANYLRYLADRTDRFALLSTGTWIIGFDAGADPARLRPEHDTACGLTVEGRPVPICRFKGGEEYALIAGDAPPGDLGTVVASGLQALPSFTDSGGPVPGTGGSGRLTAEPGSPGARAALAALYCAQMTALALERMGDPAPRVIVDGPFGQNPAYCAALAALLPRSEIRASTLREGTAAGAALLALAAEDGTLPRIPVPTDPIPAPDLPGLDAYHRRWRAALPFTPPA